MGLGNMISTVIFDLDETLIDRNRTMRRFLSTQQERFPELPGNFIDTCIKFQNNGYADKLGAHEKTCSVTLFYCFSLFFFG